MISWLLNIILALVLVGYRWHVVKKKRYLLWLFKYECQHKIDKRLYREAVKTIGQI